MCNFSVNSAFGVKKGFRGLSTLFHICVHKNASCNLLITKIGLAVFAGRFSRNKYIKESGGCIFRAPIDAMFTQCLVQQLSSQLNQLFEGWKLCGLCFLCFLNQPCWWTPLLDFSPVFNEEYSLLMSTSWRAAIKMRLHVKKYQRKLAAIRPRNCSGNQLSAQPVQIYRRRLSANDMLNLGVEWLLQVLSSGILLRNFVLKVCSQLNRTLEWFVAYNIARILIKVTTLRNNVLDRFGSIQNTCTATFCLPIL